MRTRVRKAFTLVEILIVVVILGILAAIVIPQFTNASQEAQIGNVQTQLQTIRSQVELFRVRNNGTSPDLVSAPTNTNLGDGFAELLEPPAIGGVAQQPYTRTAPINPRNKSSSVQAGTSPLGATAAAMDPAAVADGWLYDAATGEIAAVGFDEQTNKWYGMP
ncbi:MAG: prepilin-type N-terminal cleavage/methylation domain-containing protein [Phycisphaeraceae bacterium]|nr:prepilin-type N-terminal cleavage/methylation domain-containing protein [Phycisphaeraceae bacterium]